MCTAYMKSAGRDEKSPRSIADFLGGKKNLVFVGARSKNVRGGFRRPRPFIKDGTESGVGLNGGRLLGNEFTHKKGVTSV